MHTVRRKTKSERNCLKLYKTATKSHTSHNWAAERTKDLRSFKRCCLRLYNQWWEDDSHKLHFILPVPSLHSFLLCHRAVIGPLPPPPPPPLPPIPSLRPLLPPPPPPPPLSRATSSINITSPRGHSLVYPPVNGRWWREFCINTGWRAAAMCRRDLYRWMARVSGGVEHRLKALTAGGWSLKQITVRRIDFDYVSSMC